MPLAHFFLVTLSTGKKRLGCDADHLPLHSCEVKNEWSYSSTNPALIEYTGTNVFEVHLKYCHAHYHLNMLYSKTLLFWETLESQ
jgi:hypothetical protein